MTTQPAAAGIGLPNYDDDRVLEDLRHLHRHLETAYDVSCELNAVIPDAQRLRSLIETARVYVSHMHRSLTAAAYPNSGAQS